MQTFHHFLREQDINQPVSTDSSKQRTSFFKQTFCSCPNPARCSPGPLGHASHQCCSLMGTVLPVSLPPPAQQLHSHTEGKNNKNNDNKEVKERRIGDFCSELFPQPAKPLTVLGQTPALWKLGRALGTGISRAFVAPFDGLQPSHWQQSSHPSVGQHQHRSWLTSVLLHCQQQEQVWPLEIICCLQPWQVGTGEKRTKPGGGHTNPEATGMAKSWGNSATGLHSHCHDHFSHSSRKAVPKEK